MPACAALGRLTQGQRNYQNVLCDAQRAWDTQCLLQTNGGERSASVHLHSLPMSVFPAQAEYVRLGIPGQEPSQIEQI